MTVDTDTSRRRVLAGGGGLIVLGGVPTGGATSGREGDEDEAEKNDETDEPDDRPDVARVRVAHLAPDAPNVDVYVDGTPVLEDVPYATVSDYLELEPGSYTVQVVPAGEEVDAAVIEETVEIGDGDYTIAAVGEVADQNQPLQALVLEDDNSPVEGDAARIRVVHASPDAPAVDVGAGEDALFENVAFGESGYTEVPAGSYTLAIYPAGERDEPVFESEVSLAAGVVYTAFAIGYLVPEEAPANEPFDLLVTEDAIGEGANDENV